MKVRITIEDTNRKTGKVMTLVDMSMPVKGLSVDQLAYWAAEGMFALSGEIMDTMDEAEAVVPVKKEPPKYKVTLTAVNPSFKTSTIAAMEALGIPADVSHDAFATVHNSGSICLKAGLTADEACKIKASFETLMAIIEIE